MNISPHYCIYLGIALTWTILFSTSNTPGIRGYRNLGWLACYVIFIVMLFRLPFAVALTTWATFGFAGGFLYVLYEVISRAKTAPGTERPPVSFAHVPYGLLAWPIMAPEAIEYTAAELGLLKAPPAAPAPEDESGDVASSEPK